MYQKGARSLDDLAQTTNPYNLSDGQLIGLALYDDLLTRIPREECKSIYETVRGQALGIDSQIQIDIMGSYRRGQETCGDVDFLITRDPSDGRTHSGILKDLVQGLISKGFITHEVSLHANLLTSALPPTRLEWARGQVDGRLSPEQWSSSKNR